MRRLSLLALGSALAIAHAASAQHHAAAPHASSPAPHVSQTHMAMQSIMMPNMAMPFMPMPHPAHAKAHAAANASAGHSNNATAATAHANNATAPAKTSHAHHATGSAATSHTNAAHANAATTSSTTSGAATATFSSAPTAPGMGPSTSMNFPSNSINFPSEVSATSTGLPTLNFPSQSSIFPWPTMSGALGGSTQFPSYLTNVGAAGIVPGSSARTTAIPTAMLSTPVGVGGVAHGFNTHYFGRRGVPYYGSYHNYTSSNSAQQHMNRLVADLDALQPGFQANNSHYNRLQGDLMAVSVNYYRPSGSVVHNLSRNLALGMTRRQSPTINTAMLAQGLRIVVNGGHLPMNEVNTAIQQSQSLLQQGGMAPADVKAVVSEMHAVVGQARLSNRGLASGMIR